MVSGRTSHLRRENCFSLSVFFWKSDYYIHPLIFFLANLNEHRQTDRRTDAYVHAAFTTTYISKLGFLLKKKKKKKGDFPVCAETRTEPVTFLMGSS